MNWQFESMHGFFGGGMWFFLLILIIIAVFFLFKQFGSQSKSSENPMALLEKRYAKGEINKEEFEEIKKTLQS